MTEVIKLWSEQGSIVIEVRGYERPEAEDSDDAHWLRCTLTIKVGQFAGSFKAAFTTHEFVVLRDALKKHLGTLTGTVSFESTEGDLSFDIEFNKRGGATLIGTVCPHGEVAASLQFRLDTDQSALRQSLRQLERVLRRFPVKLG